MSGRKAWKNLVFSVNVAENTGFLRQIGCVIVHCTVYLTHEAASPPLPFLGVSSQSELTRLRARLFLPEAQFQPDRSDRQSADVRARVRESRSVFSFSNPDVGDSLTSSR